MSADAAPALADRQTARRVRREYTAAGDALASHVEHRFEVACLLSEVATAVGMDGLREWMARELPEIGWAEVEQLLEAAPQGGASDSEIFTA